MTSSPAPALGSPSLAKAHSVSRVEIASPTGIAVVTVFAASMMIYGLGYLLTHTTSPWLWGAPFWRVGLDLLYAIAGFALSVAWFNPAPHRLAASRSRAVARAAGLYGAYVTCLLSTVALIGPLATSIRLHDYLHSQVTRLYLHGLLFQPSMFLPGAFPGLQWNTAVNPTLFQIRLLGLCMIVLAVCGLVSRPARTAIVAACGVIGAAAYLILFSHPSMQVQVLGMDAREVTIEIPFFCMGALLGKWNASPAAWRADLAMLLFIANWISSSWFGQWNIALEWLSLPYMAACVGRMELPGTSWIRRRIGDPTAGLFLLSFPLQQLVVLRLPGHLSHGILLCAAASLLASFTCFHLVERPVQHLAARLLVPEHDDTT